MSMRRDEDHRPYMKWRSVPITKEAREAAEALVKMIEGTENRKRNRKVQDHANFVDCVKRTLADLVFTLDMQNQDRGWPHNKNYFSEPHVPVGWKHAEAVHAGLKALGFTETAVKASFGPLSDGTAYDIRITESIAAMDELNAFTFRHKIRPYKKHFAQDRSLAADSSRSVLVKELRLPETGRGERGKKLKMEVISDFDNTPEMRRLEEQQERRNEFIRGFALEHDELEMSYIDGWQRQFSGDLQGHGRFYALPRGTRHYWQLPEEQRLEIKINGENSNEIDLTASYLSIALARRKVDVAEKCEELREQYKGQPGAFIKEGGSLDPYSIPGFHRKHVKQYMSASFSNREFGDRWARGARAKLLESTGQPVPSAEKVKDAILAHFPELLENGGLEGIEWEKLAYVESEIVGRTMDDLRSRGVPCFPVHDSILIPISATALAELFLEKNYFALTGFMPLPFDTAKVFAKDAKEVQDDDASARYLSSAQVERVLAETAEPRSPIHGIVVRRGP